MVERYVSYGKYEDDSRAIADALVKLAALAEEKDNGILQLKMQFELNRIVTTEITVTRRSEK